MVVTLLLVPATACILSFLVVGTRFAQLEGDSGWVRAGSQIFLAHDVNCEVLVYGDSTAITGIDPKILYQYTHLHSCNVAQTKGAIVVLGTSALDIYLNHNQRPKYLVLQFSAADFYRAESWADTTSYMEGGIDLIRFYPKESVYTNVIRHPELLFGVTHYALVTIPINWWRHRRESEPMKHTAETPIDVHFIRNEPSFGACVEQEDIDPMFHRPDQSFIQWLRKHYQTRADHLIIDVAPSSLCDQRVPYLRKALVGIDNSLEQYPVTDFNEGFTHYTADGARLLSESVSAQIMAIDNLPGDTQPTMSMAARQSAVLR